MTQSDTFTISRRKVKHKQPPAEGKRDYHFNFYVDKVFAGMNYQQVFDYISRLRHEEGHFGHPPLSVVREACEMAFYTDPTLRKTRAGDWQILE